MSYELERAKQESIMKEAKANGAHYCNDCYHYFHEKCTVKNSVFRTRMNRGEEIFGGGNWDLIIEITNIITKEIPCKYWRYKL
jgi:hypothetical protein